MGVVYLLFRPGASLLFGRTGDGKSKGFLGWSHLSHKSQVAHIWAHAHTYTHNIYT